MREEESLNEGIEKLKDLSKRVDNAKATGDRAYNPSWHLCLDMKNMIITSIAVAEAAKERRESRGGHTRLDYPEYDDDLGMVNIIIRKGPDELNIVKSDKKIMPDDLARICHEGGCMNRKIIIQRGEKEDYFMHEFEMESGPGMVVLDAIHHIQANDAPDLAVRWNCKAGKCGSCSAEVNGEPKLMCMTRMSDYDPSEPLVIKPMKTFPVVKDLVTDVSWNYEVNKKILPYQHPDTDDPRMLQEDVDRVQEFRKCIECFLCQDVCHVLRDSDMKAEYAGPRFLVRNAMLEMHPLDQGNRLETIKNENGIGLCNITKCCTEVCPENITITDNAIIPLKERVVDEYYDPLKWIWRKLTGKTN